MAAVPDRLETPLPMNTDESWITVPNVIAPPVATPTPPDSVVALPVAWSVRSRGALPNPWAGVRMEAS